MDMIRVCDKEFKPYLGAAEIAKAVDTMAARIEGDFRDKNPVFLVILNGAFMFAADLFKRMNFPCEISFVKLASYVGTTTSSQVHHLIGLKEDLRGRNVIIVEDIVDTGLTLARLREQILEQVPADLRIAALLFKPLAFRERYKLDYTGFEIPNDFIIGYGLDYNGYGRNLPDIYQIGSE
ncbi:MAG TPA: hypoxanthine phosphoribosyltransferase [Bacteroidales bacterium]|nr:hypoxanthine phosphoribosyltransferase [Bacteroidales bacterium]HSA43466.1 hypoxanthine phosphoribosyltransferase [Bacteroidales bacterium]